MATQDSQAFHWHYGELNDKNFQLSGKGLLLLISLFSVCIILTLLCLYARWICRYSRGISPSSLAAGGEGEPPPEGQPRLAGAGGLDPLSIKRLPVHLYGGEREAQCCICLSSFREEEKVKVLPGCSHLFHPDCVDRWLSSRPSCPLCRAPLDAHKADESV